MWLKKAFAFTKQILIEEYLEGPHLSLDKEDVLDVAGLLAGLQPTKPAVSTMDCKYSSGCFTLKPREVRL